MAALLLRVDLLVTCLYCKLDAGFILAPLVQSAVDEETWALYTYGFPF